MQDYCPLCLRNGVRKNIKLFQLNLHEAVWTCEEERCLWPFGYDDFIFVPRITGNMWSCYWNDYKLVTHKSKETVPVSTDQMLDSLTKKPLIDMVEEQVKNSHVVLDNLESMSTINTSMMIENHNNNLIVDNTNSNITHIHCDDTHVHIKSVISSNDQNIKKEEEHYKKPKLFCMRMKDVDVQNTKNVHTECVFPKITSIERTNIDISCVKMDNQISIIQGSHKISQFNTVNNDIKKLIPVSENKYTSNPLSDSKKCTGLNLHKIDQSFNETKITQPDLNVTTMEIDRLPSITLRYDTLTHKTFDETMVPNKQNDMYKNNATTESVDKTMKLQDLKFKTPSTIRRGLTGGKQYEKFSFKAIKKKLEVNNKSFTSNIINQSLNQNLDLGNRDALASIVNRKRSDVNHFSDDYNKLIVAPNENCHPTISASPVTTNCRSIQVNNTCTTSSSLKNQINQLDVPILNSNVNIDSVLEHFLTNNYTGTEDLSDEWINSLLS